MVRMEAHLGTAWTAATFNPELERPVAADAELVLALKALKQEF